MCDGAYSCLSLNQWYLLATLRVAVQLDIPEPDITHISPVRENTQLITTDTDHVTAKSPESEVTSISGRERYPPCKHTYDELVEPLAWAMNSFFCNLTRLFLLGKLCMQYEGEQSTITAKPWRSKHCLSNSQLSWSTCDYTRPGQAGGVGAGESWNGADLWLRIG